MADDATQTGANPNSNENVQDNGRLDEARKAGNTWIFEGKEIERYVARGDASVGTQILNRETEKETGATLIHHFNWDNEQAFVERESSFKTNLRRIGRARSQDVDMSHLVSVNALFYKQVIDGGILRTPLGNNEFEEKTISKEQMIKHADLYPESASEAVETWIEIAKIKVYDEGLEKSFEFLFESTDFVKVLWYLGDRFSPIAAGILTFKSPTSERRRDYEQASQKIKTEREGEVSTTKLEQNYLKKIQYGIEHLINVEGISIGEEGGEFKSDKKGKDEFIILFNPIWFAEAVDVMHGSFDFMKGKSGVN